MAASFDTYELDLSIGSDGTGSAFTRDLAGLLFYSLRMVQPSSNALADATTVKLIHEPTEEEIVSAAVSAITDKKEYRIKEPIHGPSLTAIADEHDYALIRGKLKLEASGGTNNTSAKFEVVVLIPDGMMGKY